MKTFDHRGFSVCVFHGQDQEELREVEDVQTAWYAAGAERSKLIFIPMEGYAGNELDSDNFLVENYSASLTNSFMWDEIWTKDEHEKEVVRLVDKFIDTGERIVIENYDYEADEPFYDYSGGRYEN